MHRGGRRFYAAFMCHLAIEKGLKGLYVAKLGAVPPKTHNLLRLLKNLKVRPDEQTGRFIVHLNQVNVTTRYPEELAEVQRVFTEEVIRVMLDGSKAALKWIKAQL